MSVIDISVENGIGVLTLNRPEKLNAFNAELLDGFASGLEQLIGDDQVVCIVIRGEGRAFSVGYDVDEDSDRIGGDGKRYAYDDWQWLRNSIDRWMALWRAPKPVIAAVHGYCMGGATQLAVCCDLTVVAEDAVIGWPTLPLGGGLLSPVSCWLVGPKKAKELSYIVGSSMSGKEAAVFGWANYATEPENVQSLTMELAGKIALTPPDLLRIKKQALNRIMDIQGFSEAVFFGAEWDAIAHSSQGYERSVEKVQQLGLKGAVSWFKGQGQADG